MPQKPEVTLIGAGLVGSLLATELARRGHAVRLHERRPDMRKEGVSAGRSINLAVSVRGFHALGRLGLDQAVLGRSVAMRGRMMHGVDGTLTFQRYGRDDSECIHSVSRGELNKLLLSAAEEAGATIRFDERATAVDLEGRRITFRNERSGDEDTRSFAQVIGTDGSASVVREAISRATGSPVSQEPLDYGYKELTIPSGPGGAFRLEKHALHIWPRGTFMLIALPNEDGSFTCTLFLPHEGPLSFAELHHPEQVRALFEEQFSDVVPLIPDLGSVFFENPTGHMVTVKCAAWHDRDRALLLGDAAHAIVPFFGQGMNCGFEDCTALAGLLDGGLGLATFEAFQAARKANADAIADMAVENFVEMRDKVGNPRFLLEKAVERILQEKFPTEYVSRYALVSFSRVPYRLAHEAGVVQAGILAELCGGLLRAEDVDLARAGEMIRARLLPVMEGIGKT